MNINELIWNYNLKKVILYITKYKDIPSIYNSNYNIKRLAKWINNQKIYYNKNMTNENIRYKWEKFYNKYILCNEDVWNNIFKKVKTYIKKYKCKPSYKSTDNHIKKLGIWFNNQQKNYKNINITTFLCSDLQNIMNNDNIKIKWEQFIYNEEIWNNNLEKVKSYILENNSIPSVKNKLYYWIKVQKRNYNNNKFIMKNNHIRIKWEQFIDDNKKYFLSTNEIWNNHLEKVKLYILENNSKPLNSNKDPNIKQLGVWISTQIYNYKHNKFIMKDNNIKIKWKQFINEHKKYFINNDEYYSNEKKWYDILEKVKLYINEYKCKPHKTNKDNYIRKLGLWIYTQIKNYKNNSQIMKNNNIKLTWEQFIDEYKEYIVTDNDHFSNNYKIWNNYLDNIKLYIKKYNCKPSKFDKNNKIKQLRFWFDRQKNNYNNYHQIMKDYNIRIKWGRIY